MEQHSNKIFSFCIRTQSTETIRSKCFSSKLAKEKELKIGKIFGFVSIESSDPKIDDFINTIINQLKNHYYDILYHNDKDLGENNNLEEALEETLKKTNIDIFAYLEREKIILELSDIHIMIAIIRGRETVFSAAGNVSAFLFHCVSNTAFRIINVYENYVSQKEEIHPLKFFTQTIYGQIQPADYMFFCTSNVLDYLSLEKIKTIVTEQRSDAPRYLTTILSAINLPKHFLSSIVYLEKNELAQPNISSSIYNFNYQHAASKDSVKKLVHSEKTTYNLLHPTLQSSVKKIFGIFQKIFVHYIDRAKNIVASNITIRKNNTPPKKIQSTATPFSSPQPVFQPLKAIAHNAFIQKIFSFLRHWIRALYLWFVRLPIKGKFTIIIAFVLSVLLIQSILKLSLINARRNDTLKYQELLQEAQKMQDAAEASIIYQDEDTARGLYVNAIELLSRTPKRFQNNPEKISKVSELQRELEKLRHTVVIDEPLMVGNWNNLDIQARISPWIVLAQNVIYTQNQNNSNVYTLHSESHVIGSILPTVSNLDLVNAATVFRNEILLLNNHQTLFALRLNDKNILPVPIRLIDGSEITAMKTYSNNLYLLDQKNNQILKYTRNSSGFTEFQEWIRDDIVDITDSIDFTIDGSIYILKKNGEIIKLLNGKLATFSLKTIDPKIRNPLKIYTSPDTQYIYILDPPEKRIVVIDKNGNLIRQYSSPRFTSLKDFIILENEKRIYLLNSTVMYGFGM